MIEVTSVPARIAWGQPLSTMLPEQVAREGSKACFVMVSSTLRRDCEEVRRAIAALGPTCAAVYEGMRPHSPRSDVLAALNMARIGHADLVVTIGGGSLTDAGKAVCLFLEHDEVQGVKDFDKYRAAAGFQPGNFAHRGLVKQIAVPTTLSGGEHTPISGVTNEAERHKEAFVHPSLLPTAVLLDPAVAVFTPTWLWLSTGVRAVDHCVEGICSQKSHAFSDAQAAASLRLLLPALRSSAQDPGDVDARLRGLLGTVMATKLLGMGVDFGASHAIGHVLGGTADVPHGYTSCVMLPAVIAHNAPAIGHKLPVLAKIFGCTPQSVAQAIGSFIAEIGMPRSLSEVKVGRDLLPKLAHLSMSDPWLGTNPRKMDEEAVLALLTTVYERSSHL